MRVWVCYLIVPDEEYLDKQGSVDTSMTHEYNSESGLWRFIYGHTINKKLFQDFMMIHASKKYFYTEKMSMSEEEYARFYSDNRSSVIGLEELEVAFNTKVEIPMTSMESVYTIYYKDETYFELLSTLVPIPPSIFRKKYYDDLLNLGYAEMYYTVNGTSDERDYFFYNDSYRIHPKTTINTLGLYWLLYKDFVSIEALNRYILEKGEKK